MNKFDVKNHAPSYLPDGKWKLVWADEFDGTELDRTKWDFRLNFWGEPFEAFTTEGVVLDGNSHLEMHRTERNGCYVSPQLQTGSIIYDAPKEEDNSLWRKGGIWPFAPAEKPKFVHRYGYYECRCKMQQDPERWWSAFWMQSPSIGARFEPEWCGVECDIMEYFHKDEITTGNIYGGYGPQLVNEGRVTVPLPETEDGWHYFGMDWQPDGYVFYCDGKEITRCSDHVSHVPEFLLLTTEIQGYRKRATDVPGVIKQKIEGEFVDDAFIVDFVRVFDKIEG
ncbi:MAG: glycoside hydrolase family 16 protein [Clostridia bacterium]|nr:glycoside hydrolase family 16 protein [Clostridia bacterium]